MWSDRVPNPGLLALESDALPTAPRGPAMKIGDIPILHYKMALYEIYQASEHCTA